MSGQWIGWISGFVLLLTIGKQTWEQWQTNGRGGASPWLFVGQLAASTGFAIYAALLNDPVFIATNLLLLVSAALGLYAQWRGRRSRRRSGDAEQAAPGVGGPQESALV